MGSRRREMGPGPFPAVSLKEARAEADEWRTVVRSGLDSIKERQREKWEAERNLHLLKDIAADAFESRKAELKGDGKAGRWFSLLELHVLSRLGGVPVSNID
ncbi:MAG: Arm DNA-binding domain-containing protein [Litoreibacter sp.]|uniref:integrase arm-type DNA-binding domain-containing protein n=1 Tax=Litoreibacter sp. TaxID=1969459 RepID=UPI003297C952